MTQDLLITLIARVENGFGRLEEGQIQNRLASEARTQELHHRIDQSDQVVRSEIRRLDTKIDSMPRRTSSLTFGSVASVLITHWQIVAAVILVLAGLAMGKSPDTIKTWLKALG